VQGTRRTKEHIIIRKNPSVTITFEFQKIYPRGISDPPASHWGPVLCPVDSWAAIVHRVLSYPPGTDVNSPVNRSMHATGRTAIELLSSKDHALLTDSQLASLRSIVVAIMVSPQWTSARTTPS
jgi:hypothetical protein